MDRNGSNGLHWNENLSSFRLLKTFSKTPLKTVRNWPKNRSIQRRRFKDNQTETADMKTKENRTSFHIRFRRAFDIDGQLRVIAIETTSTSPTRIQFFAPFPKISNNNHRKINRNLMNEWMNECPPFNIQNGNKREIVGFLRPPLSRSGSATRSPPPSTVAEAEHSSTSSEYQCR